MDTQEAIKKYWPWALGIVVGLLLIVKMRGSSSSGSPDLASFYTAQANAASQNAQIGLAQAQLQASINDQAQKNQLARDTLTANTNIAYLNAQGQTAQAIGQAATGVIGALYSPINTAMAAASNENAAAFTGAAQVAALGFASQAQMVGQTAASIGAAGNSLAVWGPVSQSIAQSNASQAANNPLNRVIGAAGSFANVYAGGILPNYANARS